jgi:folate-binding protein YgfZ
MHEATARGTPLDYGDAAAEYRAVRHSVGVVDRSDRGVLEATGRDRAAFLHALLSNEVKALAPGQGCAASLLDIHGKVQVTLLVWVLDDRIVLVTPPGMANATYEMLDKYLFAEKVALEDVTTTRALRLLTGPDAPALAKRVAGAAPPETPWSSVTGTLDGVEVRLVRGGGETGEAEVWIMAPAADAGTRIWDVLVAAGAKPIGEAAVETLRIEAGTPRFGRDVDATVLLPEIPFDTLMSQTKGCYPGQEVVVRIRDRGHVNRHLRGLVLEGGEPPAAGAQVWAGDAAIGHDTSATRSPALGRPVALAFVRRQHAAPGTRVEVRSGGRVVGATVSDLPFAR